MNCSKKDYNAVTFAFLYYVGLLSSMVMSYLLTVSC